MVSIDSLPSVEDQVTLDFAATFNIIQTCYAVANMSTNLSSWKFFSCTDIPKQKNWYDCGVHVIANAYCFIHKLELATDISSLPARKWVQSLADSWPKRLIHKKKEKSFVMPHSKQRLADVLMSRSVSQKPVMIF